MTATAFPTASPDSVARGVCNDLVRLHGLKRGLHCAAEALGVTERWARALRAHESGRVSADVYLRALEAQRAIRAERRARLLSQLAELDAADASDPPEALAPAARNPDAGLAGDDRRHGGRVVRGKVAGAERAAAAAALAVTR